MNDIISVNSSDNETEPKGKQVDTATLQNKIIQKVISKLNEIYKIEKGTLISGANAILNHGLEINTPLSDIKDKRFQPYFYILHLTE